MAQGDEVLTSAALAHCHVRSMLATRERLCQDVHSLALHRIFHHQTVQALLNLHGHQRLLTVP